MSSYVGLIPWIFAMVFAAGVLYAGDVRIRKDLDGGFRQIRNDLNGIGARTREDSRRLSDELQSVLLALMVISEKREDREKIAELLKP